MEIPTWHRAPNFSIPPDGHVQLGTIVSDLEQLEAINGDDIAPISPGHLHKTESKGFQTTIATGRSLELGFWAKIFAPIAFGAEVGHGRQNDVETNIYVQQLETKYFFPSDEYIDMALERPTLRTYMQATHKKYPVYMITGVKIARGATWQTSKARANNATLGLSVPDPFSGMVEIGPKVKSSMTRSSSTQVEDGGAFVLAYRATKIWYRGPDRLKTKRYLKGAIMAGDYESDNESLEEVDMIRDIAADGITAEIIETSLEEESSGIERSVWILHEAP